MRVDVSTSMPCFLKLRSASLLISGSSVGSTRSSASNNCTRVPSRANADAISAPEAPAPSTAMDARQLLERPRLLGADDALAEGDARKRPLDRARGEDHRPRLDRPVAHDDVRVDVQRP